MYFYVLHVCVFVFVFVCAFCKSNCYYVIVVVVVYHLVSL